MGEGHVPAGPPGDEAAGQEGQPGHRVPHHQLAPAAPPGHLRHDLQVLLLLLYSCRYLYLRHELQVLVQYMYMYTYYKAPGTCTPTIKLQVLVPAKIYIRGGGGGYGF